MNNSDDEGWVIVDETPNGDMSNNKTPTGTEMSKPYTEATGGKTRRPYIQPPFALDSQIKKIEGSDPLVSWYLNNGKTQIQIARVDFKKAKFDVVIIPVDKYMKGVNIFNEGSFKCNYGSWPTQVKQSYIHGNVYNTNHKSKKLVCKNIVLGVCLSQHNEYHDKNIASIVNTMLNDEKYTKNCQTICIPLDFSRLYDPLVFLDKVVQKRKLLSETPLTIVFGCKEIESKLSPFMQRVNEIMCEQRSPRQVLHSKDQGFKDAFEILCMETRLLRKGILESECECIVAVISDNFKLRGKVNKSISEAAGSSQLQETIDELVRNGVPDDNIICCPSFKLANRGIKSILFGRLPKPTNNDKQKIRKILSNFVKQCMLVADNQGCKSIAFPALGSGYLDYPYDVIATSLINGIDKYAESGMQGSMKIVCISCFGVEDELYEKLESGISRSVNRLNTQQKLLNNDIPSTSNTQSNESNGMQQTVVQGIEDTQAWQGSTNMDDSQNQGLSSSENKTLKTGDMNEMLLDEVTAYVNPGLTKYLMNSGQISKFKDHFTQTYRIKVDNEKETILFRGSLSKIIDAQNHLDEIVETGSLFNDNAKPESKSAPSSIEHAADKSPSYSGNIGQTGNNLTSSFNPFADSSITPKDTVVHNLFAYGKCVHIFKTKDIFSFSTDVKVLKTDNEHTHKQENLFLRQAVDKIPKLENIQVEKFGIFRIVKPCTCNYIVMTLVPNNSKTIARKENEKARFKASIVKLTTDILQGADKLNGVQSITLPLLVNAEENDAHTAVCCHAMAEGIHSFLSDKTNIKHINVLLESESTVKMLNGCLKDKGFKLSTDF